MRVIKNVNRIYTGKKTQEISDYEIQNRRVAREAAAEGMVLLENCEHILPLQPGSKVALYGSGAVKTIKGGSGSGDVNERETISIWAGMKNAGYEIVNEDWLSEYKCLYEIEKRAWRDRILEITGNREHAAFFRTFASHPFQIPAGSVPNLEKVKEYDCDIAFYIISRTAGESADRKCEKGDYYLSDEELQVLDGVCKCYSNVILVLNSGGIIDLGFKECYPSIKAVIQMGQCGMESGNAFADVVSGKVTFGGHLTDTWAFRYEDYPNATTFSYMDGNVHKEYYKEGIYVGYRYFDTFDIPVRYCFGHGLSYTDFETNLMNIVYKAGSLDKAGEIRVTVEVRNVGERYAGKEVVQIYASCPQNKIKKEFRRLVAFAKTKSLEPGERQKIELSISLKGLSSYCEEKSAWIMEEGMYGIWIGNSLDHAKVEASIELDKTVILEQDRAICLRKEELEEIFPNEDSLLKKEAKWKTEVAGKSGIVLPKDELYTKEVVYGTEESLLEKEALQIAKHLFVEQCVQMCTGAIRRGKDGTIGTAGISVPGAAAETSLVAVDEGIASITLADGPAGLRLNKFYDVVNGERKIQDFIDSVEDGLFRISDEKQGERYYQFCTAFPIGTVLAQSWDREVMKKVGRAVATELEIFQITLWLAPGMNIHRNPLCGRNFEYYSEDPLISGIMAADMTEGVQETPGIGTTIKHFACNNQEDNRLGSDSIISERALREIYLRGFEICVKEAQPMAIMTSYNLINGIHAANSHDLCTKAARDEWGFRGLIMTDWGTTNEMPEGYTKCSRPECCIQAGNDLICPGVISDHEQIRAALKNGTLKESELRRSVARLIAIILKSNAYE